MENSWIAGWNHWMEPHLIATLKAEETLFSLLRQIQKHLMFFVYVLQKLRHFLIKFLNCPGLPVVPNIRSCGQMDLLSIKLDYCLPLAYPTTLSINTFLHIWHLRNKAAFLPLWTGGTQTEYLQRWYQILLPRDHVVITQRLTQVLLI